MTPLKMREKRKAHVHSTKKAEYTLQHLAEMFLHVALHCHIASGAGIGRVVVKRTDRQIARAGWTEEVPGWG